MVYLSTDEINISIDFFPEYDFFIKKTTTTFIFIERILARYGSRQIQYLTNSISRNGFFESCPITVYKKKDRYFLIDGLFRLSIIRYANNYLNDEIYNSRKIKMNNLVKYAKSEFYENGCRIPCVIIENKKELNEFRYDRYRHKFKESNRFKIAEKVFSSRWIHEYLSLEEKETSHYLIDAYNNTHYFFFYYLTYKSLKEKYDFLKYYPCFKKERGLKEEISSFLYKIISDRNTYFYLFNKENFLQRLESDDLDIKKLHYLVMAENKISESSQWLDVVKFCELGILEDFVNSKYTLQEFKYSNEKSLEVLTRDFLNKIQRNTMLFKIYGLHIYTMLENNEDFKKATEEQKSEIIKNLNRAIN